MAATVRDLYLYRWSALRIDAPLLHRFASRYNWDEGIDLLRRCLRHPACSLATALLIYWRGHPYYYSRYAKRADVPAHERDVYDLLRAIERRVADKKYPAGGTFDPRRSGLATPAADDIIVRPPPDHMFVAVRAKKNVPFARPTATPPRKEPAKTPREPAIAVNDKGGWRTHLELDFGWAADDNPDVDQPPRVLGLAALCKSIGPFPGLANELSPSLPAWTGCYRVTIEPTARVKITDHAYDFGFREKRTLDTALRTLRCVPAKRAGKPVRFVCLLTVSLSPTSPRARS